MDTTQPDPDAYYDDDNVDTEELDLSFLDEEDEEEAKDDKTENES